ncbi:nucleotidyltransferase domain-containing protein [Shouchella shacheensis]|uniref:nucleotidyltransferase domain-containing protein n=1 Tax=Shouchella shacheensis TaxID=1649580 RepID=UPI00074006F3|nr:nucleotidyltransferase domain-containing protein [Shouchella shacheensis]
MGTEWNSTGISKRFMKELQDLCAANEQIEKVLLFGSRARGDYTRTSDIDLAVFTSVLSHSQQNLIEAQIDEMSTPLKVDVLFVDRVTKEKLISNIEKEGAVIFEQREALRKT